MKKPLGYQNTEHDSLATSFINALKYVLNKKEISLEILNKINELNLKNNELENDFITRINECAKNENLNIELTKLPSNEINEETIKKITEDSGAIISKCYGNHYVLITKIDEVNIFLFDPYYLDLDYPKEDDEYKIICDEPFKYNRIVHNDRFLNSQEKSYSLAKPQECIVIKSRELA